MWFLFDFIAHMTTMFCCRFYAVYSIRKIHEIRSIHPETKRNRKQIDNLFICLKKKNSSFRFSLMKVKVKCIRVCIIRCVHVCMYEIELHKL